MKTVTVRRWISLVAEDVLTLRVPDDWDVNEHDVYDQTILSETRETLDSTDSGAWEIVNDSKEAP